MHHQCERKLHVSLCSSSMLSWVKLGTHAGGKIRIHDLSYLEGPEYPEYVMHICYLKYSGTPKYRNVLGDSSPSWSCPTNNRKLTEIFSKGTCCAQCFA